MQHFRQTTYKDAAEIKAAIDKGVRVFQHNSGYEVIKDSIGQFLITWLHGTPRAHYIGLTWNDGKTLNGKAWQFYSLHEDDPANS
jgi:hypothetical protein